MKLVAEYIKWITFFLFHRAFLLLATGLLAITAGILVKIFEPYELIFRWKLVFEEGGEIFGLWEKPPVDLYIKIYLFNVTNADEFMAGEDDKMKVEEIGPYVYKEALEHSNIVFNKNNTLSTNPKHPLIWQEEMSQGRREDDILMMPNIALLSIAHVAAEKSYFIRMPINLVITTTKSQPLVKMTAHEFMFGFETPLTTLGNTLLPGWISFDKVGLIDRMYDFSTDFETFYTGTDDPSKSGLYETYRGSKTLPQWEEDHCKNIEMASDGTKFKSYLEPNETVLFFRKSMCRPLRMIREPGDYIVSDLLAHKYVFENNSLDNGEYDQRNKCYCRKGYCQPLGLVDVTDCYYGFPISLSYPHFMDSDPQLLKDVIGCQPNRSLHSSYFMIQPKSGLPLRCSVKFQINMHIRDVGSMTNVERFSDVTIPMLWFEIALLELPSSLKSRFNLYLNILTYIDPLGFWFGIVGGLACLAIAVGRAATNFPLFGSSGNKPNSRRYSETLRRSSVYKPCEEKLMQLGETKIFHDNEQHSIVCDLDISDIQYHDDTDDRYTLEQEPAILDDEGNISDNSSRQSSLYLADVGSRRGSKVQANDKISCNSSSGFDSREGNADDSWQMGEASSLIDDIDEECFTPLRISESYECNVEKDSSNRRKSII